jgi:Protein of unknown function (DUF4019)
MQSRTLGSLAFICIAVARMCLAMGPTDDLSTSKILGVWSSATLESIGPVLRPECLQIVVTQRNVTLKLNPQTKQLEGEWVRWSRAVWMASDHQTCRWPEMKARFEPIIGASWTYQISGQSYSTVRQALTISGQYTRCDGNACDVLPRHDQSFTTEVMLLGNKLVDTNGTPDPSDDIEFVRLSDEIDLLEDGRVAVEGWLKLLDAGKLETFYDNATTISFRHNQDRDSFTKAMSAQEAGDGQVVSRHYLLTTHVLYFPALSAGRVDCILFSNVVQTSLKKTGAEFMILANDGGEWKILQFRYGS